MADSVDVKTVGASSLVALGIILASAIVPGFFDDPKYYCETRPELGLVECDDFSKYVASNGKCIRYEDSNLICRDGWALVTDDTVLPDEEVVGVNPSPVQGTTYCYSHGCEVVQ